MSSKDTSGVFNKVSGTALPETDFCAFLKAKFGAESAVQVVQAFDRIGLPLPENKEEFLIGTEGCLVLLNPYGMVLRIEITDLEESDWPIERINDSGWILQPIATIEAGKATLELCPGTEFERDEKQNRFLESQLLNEKINFWDSAGIDNVGRLPIKMPLFPEGVPVVIDRLSVVHLWRSTEPVYEALKAYADEAKKAQDLLYQPLRRMFDECMQSVQGREAFWLMCRANVREGKLVAGWNEAQDGDSGKSQDAADAARAYAQRLPKSEPVVPQRSFADWLKQRGNTI